MPPSRVHDPKSTPSLVGGCGLPAYWLMSRITTYTPNRASGSGHSAFHHTMVARPPSVPKMQGRQNFNNVNTNPLRLIREGSPLVPLRSLRLPATDRRGRGRPSEDRSDVPTARRAIDMSPHNDRCTSQATVPPDQDGPDTTAAAFSSSRAVIHSSIGSIRRVSKVHHRVHTTEIICNRADKNQLRTDGIKGTWRNSRPFDTASCSQYWGRRRYGPL
jgi:hypothetical protein